MQVHIFYQLTLFDNFRRILPIDKIFLVTSFPKMTQNYTAQYLPMHCGQVVKLYTKNPSQWVTATVTFLQQGPGSWP